MKIKSIQYIGVLFAIAFILTSGLSTAYAQVDDTFEPSLKLVKSVITDDGGNAEADDWLLSAQGVDGAIVFSNSGGSGVFETIILTNEYTLSESDGPDGYASTGIWNCDGGTFATPDKITINPGESLQVTCTITNNDVAPTLKLVKELVLDDGGTAIPNNWTLTAMAEEPDPVDRNVSTLGGQGAFVEVYANVRLQLAESGGPDGYTALNNGLWTCVLTLPNNDVFTIPFPIGAITLNEGDSAVCTITNDDIPEVVEEITPIALTRDQQRAVDHAIDAQTRADNSTSNNQEKEQNRACEKIQREISK